MYSSYNDFINLESILVVYHLTQWKKKTKKNKRYFYTKYQFFINNNSNFKILLINNRRVDSIIWHC